MGAGYGHIMHPYEDKELTFKGLAELLFAAANGFTSSSFVWEKTDGINLMVTWKDGQPRFARNKRQMANFGASALTEQEIGEHFSSLPEVQRVIAAAASHVAKGLKSASPIMRGAIFQEGQRFASLEVMHPDTPNVIRYMKPIVAVHGMVQVDDDGNKVGIHINGAMGDESVVAALSRTPGQFTVIGQSRPNIEPIKPEETESMINHIESMNNSKHNGVLVADWARRKVRSVLLDRMIQDSISMDTDVAARRIFDGDKDVDLRAISKLYGKDASEWLKGLDRSASQIRRQAMTEIHDRVIAIGANVLERSTGLISGKDQAVAKLHTMEAYRATVKAIMNDGNASDKARYFREMIVIGDLGGIDRLPPMEGVVFDHGGKTYKLTGLFTPVHRVNSILKFKKEPTADVQPQSAN